MKLPIHIGRPVELYQSPEFHIEGMGHMYVISKSGWGKSTLLRVIIKAAMDADMSVFVNDPHGQLVDASLNDVPSHKIDRTVVLDPSDEEYVVPWNILAGDDPEEVVEIVTKILSNLWRNSWQGRSDYLGRNILTSVLEVEPEPTFLHFAKAVTNEQYLDHIFSQVTSSNLKLFYQSTKKAWSPRDWTEALSPIQNKVDALVNKRAIRNMLSRYKGLDIDHQMNTGGVVFGRFSAGRIGDESSALFQWILRAKVRAAAFHRDRHPDQEWHPVLFVNDEFHTQEKGDNAGKMYAEVRKYKIYLVISDQDLTNLPEGSESQILGNAETSIVGAVSDQDAERLAGNLQIDEPGALQRVTRFHWHVKQGTGKAVHIEALNVKEDSNPERVAAVKEQSRRRWSIPRKWAEEDVEKILMAEAEAPRPPKEKKTRRNLAVEAIRDLDRKLDERFPPSSH